MPLEVKEVMAGKHIEAMIKLFEDLAILSGIADPVLVDGLRIGFNLTGLIRPTGRWKADWRLPTLSEGEHTQMSKWLRREVPGKCSHRLDDHAYEALEDRLPRMRWRVLGDGAVFARRFVIKQRDKYHPIDDYTASRACVSTAEKARVDPLDDVLATARSLIEAAATVRLHPDWHKDDGLQVVGCCLDVTGAYKQFAVDPRSKHRGVAVPLRKSKTGYEIYITKVLHFGGTSSVYHFLKISESLSEMQLECGIVQSAYFDDFPTATYSEVGSATQFPHKRKAFSVDLLGVRLVFLHPAQGKGAIEVLSTPEKKEEITEPIERALETRSLALGEAFSLIGKLGFLNSPVWNRIGVLMLGPNHRKTEESEPTDELNETFCESLRAVLLVLQGPPRRVP
eukprot:3899745-Amphidinium_carterae.2